MTFDQIAAMVLRGLFLGFGVFIMLWAPGRPGKGRHRASTALLWGYLVSLFMITAIRQGEHLLSFWRMDHSAVALQLTPITVTLQQGRAGLLYLLWPVLGNIFWFLPFGLLWRHRQRKKRLLPLLFWAMSLSLSIEFLQWLFLSGVPDVDDVLFNTLGAGLGAGLHAWFWKRK